MTKVQLRYDLLKPLDESLMEKIARLHTVYGIIRLGLAPSLDKLTVEYDASRLNAKQVETILYSAGLPIVQHA